MQRCPCRNVLAKSIKSDWDQSQKIQSETGHGGLGMSFEGDGKTWEVSK